MRTIAARTRIGIQQPSYAYRLFVPLAELSPERQSLISYRSSFGVGSHDDHLARLSDVVAPLRHLASPPGLNRFHQSLAIDAVADRVAAMLLNAIFPEMDARRVPFRLLVASAPSNAVVSARINDLTGRYRRLAADLETLDARLLGLVRSDAS